MRSSPHQTIAGQHGGAVARGQRSRNGCAGRDGGSCLNGDSRRNTRHMVVGAGSSLTQTASTTWTPRAGGGCDDAGLVPRSAGLRQGVLPGDGPVERHLLPARHRQAPDQERTVRLGNRAGTRRGALDRPLSGVALGAGLRGLRGHSRRRRLERRHGRDRRRDRGPRPAPQAGLRSAPSRRVARQAARPVRGGRGRPRRDPRPHRRRHGPPVPQHLVGCHEPSRPSRRHPVRSANDSWSRRCTP